MNDTRTLPAIGPFADYAEYRAKVRRVQAAHAEPAPVPTPVPGTLTAWLPGDYSIYLESVGCPNVYALYGPTGNRLAVGNFDMVRTIGRNLSRDMADNVESVDRKGTVYE
jgi:hypothetical protein